MEQGSEQRSEQGPSAPRPRRASLVVARAAALVVSIGVVTGLAVQAGLSGCVSSSPGPDYEFAEDPAGPRPTSDPASSGTARPGKPKRQHYMPGPKAPAGPWAYPDEDERPAMLPPQMPQPQPQAPQPQAPQQGKPQ